MIKYNLQFFGGRGAGSGGSGLAASSGEPINIVSTTDVWSMRNRDNNAPFVDDINRSIGVMQNDFPDVMNTVYSVDAAELGGADRTATLGYWSASDGTLALNAYYTDIGRMNAAYDAGGTHHPGRGDRSAVEAVTYHEMGHALTSNIAQKMGVGSLDESSKRIVDDAYAASKGTGGTKKWAGAISRYAQKNYAECVAEAVCDYYCNGRKATEQSRAIMRELRKYK